VIGEFLKRLIMLLQIKFDNQLLLIVKTLDTG